MNKEIFINNQKLSYNLRKSKRAKRLRLTVYCDGDFVVTIPHRMGENFAEKFIREKSDWILKKIKKFLSGEVKRNRLLHRQSKIEYKKNKKLASDFVNDKIEYFNQFYNFNFNRISIRNQRTRWGSCSQKGNLNFNYKIIFLPERCAEYIIVHELCHLGELNHSRRFWDLVARTIPEYKEITRKLRKI